MERTIVSVMAAERGWRVECVDHRAQELRDVHRALLTASNLAREVHQSTGRPTAVKVQMGCGDGIMMGFNG